jgi:hypothetical protein
MNDRRFAWGVLLLSCLPLLLASAKIIQWYSEISSGERLGKDLLVAFFVMYLILLFIPGILSVFGWMVGNAKQKIFAALIFCICVLNLLVLAFLYFDGKFAVIPHSG